MLIDRESGKVKVTPDELNDFRSSAAKNGHTVNKIESTDELFKAAIDGLDEEHIAGLEEAFKDLEIKE